MAWFDSSWLALVCSALRPRGSRGSRGKKLHVFVAVYVVLSLFCSNAFCCVLARLSFALRSRGARGPRSSRGESVDMVCVAVLSLALLCYAMLGNAAMFVIFGFGLHCFVLLCGHGAYAAHAGIDCVALMCCDVI